MLENMTTGEKALIGATAIGIAALVFHKPTRNAVGLSDGRKKPRYDFLPHLTKKVNLKRPEQQMVKEVTEIMFQKHTDMDNGIQKQEIVV